MFFCIHCKDSIDLCFSYVFVLSFPIAVSASFKRSSNAVKCSISWGYLL